MEREYDHRPMLWMLPFSKTAAHMAERVVACLEGSIVEAFTNVILCSWVMANRTVRWAWAWRHRQIQSCRPRWLALLMAFLQFKLCWINRFLLEHMGGPSESRFIAIPICLIGGKTMFPGTRWDSLYPQGTKIIRESPGTSFSTARSTYIIF